MPQTRGYFLGRLFALLAKHEALEHSPEQLYRQASTVPPQVIPPALATMIAAGKEEALFPLMRYLPLDAFDGPLNRREQGAFALGYLHEQSGHPIAREEEEHDSEEQELTERYEFRVDAQLKEWIKANGGGTFIRTLLRTQRAQLMQEVSKESASEEKEGA